MKSLYTKETLKEAGLTIVFWLTDEEVVLKDSDGKRELWVYRPYGHAGYGVLIDGEDFEFCSSIQE